MSKQWGRRRSDNRAYPKGSIPISGGKYDNIPPPTKALPEVPINKQGAREINLKYRSDIAIKIDNERLAPITKDLEKWSKHPDQYDVSGVDHFPVKTVPGDTHGNFSRFEERIEQFLDTKLVNRPEYHFYESVGDFAKAYRSGMSSDEMHKAGIAGFVRNNEIHFGPEVTMVLKRGSVADKEDYIKFNTLTHETIHLLGRWGDRGSWMSEGSTELLSTNWMINNVNMPASVREEQREYPHPSYHDSVRAVGNMALIVNNGDPEKSLEWIKDIRKGVQETHPMYGKGYSPGEYSEMKGVWESAREDRENKEQEFNRSFEQVLKKYNYRSDEKKAIINSRADETDTMQFAHFVHQTETEAEEAWTRHQWKIADKHSDYKMRSFPYNWWMIY